ncbi:MAG: peptidoglycan DD-metalloendopeptidase family protein, partial [Deltaproteobacteria bacterium]|nr:peptidoglycan DD-metalloendopeptidase family protein [Deltaproteobacteria bacterium]
FSNPPDDSYLNPTGFGTIRHDSAGFGHFEARRKNPDGTKRKHNSLDILSIPGQPIYAPLDGEITFTKGYYSAIENTGENHDARILYIRPTERIASGKGTIKVKKGDVIGYAQNLYSIYKNTKMKNHIHLELFTKRKDGKPGTKKQRIDPKSHIWPGVE